jgi:glucuronoarabinoxylan endo-1,4-beta-xylanase
MKAKQQLVFWILVLFLPVVCSLLMPVNAASPCTINYTTTYQKIDGFGCTTAFHAARNLMNFSEPARTRICDLLWSPTTGAGLSILRNMVGDSGTWGTDIDGPNPSIEPSDGVWNWTGDEDQLWAMDQAASRGCTTFLSTVWSPPAWMKDNNSVINGGHLRTDKYQKYADYLAEYVNGYKSHHNKTIAYISIANEPNLSTNYSSCLWTSTEFKNFIGTYLKPTFQNKSVPAKVVAPEYMSFSETLIVESLNDANANSRLDVVAAHAYGGDGYSPMTTANSKGKTIWMSEWLDQGTLDNTITGGIKTAKLIHNHLTNANVSAWLYMYGPGKTFTSNSSLVCLNTTDKTSYEIRKRLWTMGNYARWIRPGSTRISATANPTSNVYVSAFKDPSGKLVIVAINDNSAASDVSFTLQGYTTSTVTPYQTSGAEDLAQLSSISVSGGFTTSLAAKSVTTFVAGGSVATPTPTRGATPTSRPTPTPSVTTTATPTPTGNTRSAFSQIEAESFNTQSGIQTENCGEGGQNIGYIENGDYVVYNSIDFAGGATGFQARVASATSGGNIEIRLDGITGALVGTCSVAGTGGWQTWTTRTCNVSGASGTHNLYLRFTGGSGYLFNLNWFKFTSGSINTPTPTKTPTPSSTATPTARVNTPTPTPTSSATPTPTPGSSSTYEAESGTTLTSCLVETAYPGYTGTGYVNFNASSGAAIQWNSIYCGTAGTINLKFRYALASGTRNLDVYVNGTKVISNTAFAATGSWTTWGTKTIQVTMNSGNNTLKLVTTGTEGPNMDNVNVSAAQ